MSTESAYEMVLTVAVGTGRKDTHWKNREMTWGAFVEKLRKPLRTSESVAEYRKMGKERQSEVKDVGGFVGGHLTGGRRKAGAVLFRSMLTLDLDFARDDTWERFTALYPEAAVVYTTHSHTKERPRMRLVVPLSRDTAPDEYEAVARSVAGNVGIDLFDDTTYQPERLMYWPSCPRDGDYVFEVQDGPALDVDGVLASYKDWRDIALWPVSSRQDGVLAKSARLQGDPTEKPWPVGTFCRTYDIDAAIAAYLADVYAPCDNAPGRYTYIKGSTGAGLVVYDGGKFAYSNHATDPASGTLCNAFDLVRVHLYGDLDEGKATKDKSVLPSFTAMVELMKRDKAVMETAARERVEQAARDFDGVGLDEEDTEWIAGMDMDKKGVLKNTPGNFETVLTHDRNLAGKIAVDEFSGRVNVRGRLPWREQGDKEPLFRDDDESALYLYLSRPPYELDSKQRMQDALKSVARRNAFHPVREYLEAQRWDGTQRVDTFFIDYMGVEDTPYARAVTRKALVAAVARIMSPGTPFDYMPVLMGEEGLGKSKLLARLAVRPEWFTDNFTVDGKEAAENIQGRWIVEAAELNGMRKSEATAVKAFITRTQDVYRAAFERYVVGRPRQCVFFGTTNETDFLKGENGDRRFWPLEACRERIGKDKESLTGDEVAQIWAEAVQAWRDGEKLYLTPELEQEAREKQKAYAEQDERTGLVAEYLRTLLPSDWAARSIESRKEWFRARDPLSAAGTEPREKVCALEVWCECFGQRKGDIRKTDTREINKILTKIIGCVINVQPISFGIYGTQRGFWIRKVTFSGENASGKCQGGVGDERSIF